VTESLFEPADATYDPGVLAIDVLGMPAPQGSKRAFVNKKTGRAQVVESSKDRVNLWRSDVVNACDKVRENIPDFIPFDGPIRLTFVFRMPRPKSHYRTGRNAHLLRDNAPAYPAGKPDLDKLIRSTADAMTTAGMYRDDSQIVDLGQTRKLYCAPNERPGALIIVRPL
jgi:Holliday junction resolvase RusA-like endonuclease